jgi:hypothetical protein
MKRIALALGIGCAALAGCVAPNPVIVDPLCKAIADFATSAPAAEVHVVDLTGGRRNTPPVPYHACRHRGFAPGQDLCGYLLAQTTWEFGAPYAGKAFSCLASNAGRQVTEGLAAGAALVEATSRLRGKDAPSRLMHITFERAPDSELYTLKIEAR